MKLLNILENALMVLAVIAGGFLIFNCLYIEGLLCFILGKLYEMGYNSK